jgi:hypothetical protein
MKGGSCLAAAQQKDLRAEAASMSCQLRCNTGLPPLLLLLLLLLLGVPLSQPAT